MSLRIFVPRDAGAVAVGADEVALALGLAASKRGVAGRLSPRVDAAVRSGFLAAAFGRLRVVG